MSASAALQSTATEDFDAVALGRAATARLERLLAEATSLVRSRVTEGGRISSALLEKEQRATHGLAWLATYVFSVRELVHYADRLTEMGKFGDTEKLIVQIGLGEYIAQVLGGIPMSQGEIVRLADLYVPVESIAALAAVLPPAISAATAGSARSAPCVSSDT